MRKFIGFTGLLALMACGNEGGINIRDAGNVVPFPPPDENPIQNDRIVQIQQPKVDILFIIDNSCSMAEEQAALGTNFPEFMGYFLNSGLDYHIGVTSTDVDSPNTAGLLRNVQGKRFIDQETAQPEVVFSLMANMGTGGSADEKGRAAAYSLIELKGDNPANQGFIREEAALHMVFISDENDYSSQPPVGEFSNWLGNLKESPDLVTAHAITGIAGQTCAAVAEAGTFYTAYAQGTGGIVFNLCEENWGPLLDELGLQASGLKREYFLSKIPVTTPWSLGVKVKTEIETGQRVEFSFVTCLAGEDVEDDCEVVYNPGRNSITFLDYVPDSFSEILVSYNIREYYETL